MGITELMRRSSEELKGKIPITPKKKHVSGDVEDPLDANECATVTVSRRRGYRPLSVFTPSVFFPFDGETAKAMALLIDLEESNHVSSTSPESPCAPRTSDPILENPFDVGSPTASQKLSHQHDKSSSTLTQNSSPVSKSEIKCSYPGLMFLPPPDPSQHPAFQTDPFTSISDGPDLICTSTAEEIRKLSSLSQNSQGSSFGTSSTPSFGGSIGVSYRTSGSSEANSSDDKKTIYIPDYIRSPDPILGKKGFSARMQGSPLAGRFCEIVIPENTTSLPEVGDGDQKRVGSGSLRKLSDIFKAKLSGERSRSASSCALETSDESNMSFLEPRLILEEKLRASTYSPNYRYQPNSVFPRHPATGRNWKSRNLKCTTCLEQPCANCGRACCAFRSSATELEIYKDDVDRRAAILQRIQEITMVYPYGKEAPTFLRCLMDQGTGCGRVFCPDCCGQCPDPWCKDIQCYNCKQDPWISCEWHANLTFGDAAPDSARIYELLGTDGIERKSPHDRPDNSDR